MINLGKKIPILDTTVSRQALDFLISALPVSLSWYQLINCCLMNIKTLGIYTWSLYCFCVIIVILSAKLAPYAADDFENIVTKMEKLLMMSNFCCCYNVFNLIQ